MNWHYFHLNYAYCKPWPAWANKKEIVYCCCTNIRCARVVWACDKDYRLINQKHIEERKALFLLEHQSLSPSLFLCRSFFSRPFANHANLSTHKIISSVSSGQISFRRIKYCRRILFRNLSHTRFDDDLILSSCLQSIRKRQSGRCRYDECAIITRNAIILSNCILLTNGKR